jgi:hypothetical protein
MQLTRRELATIQAALEYWKEELEEGADWIPDSNFFAEYSALSIAEVDDLATRLASSNVEIASQHGSTPAHSTRNEARNFAKRDTTLKQIKLMVPTYNANYYEKHVSKGTKPEFGTPYLPVLVHSADGVRVVLGTHQFLDVDAPDIAIERQPRAWAIFLHPIGGGDPVGYIYFLDDGRSYLLREHWIHPDEGIQILEHDERVPHVHGDDAR